MQLVEYVGLVVAGDDVEVDVGRQERRQGGRRGQGPRRERRGCAQAYPSHCGVIPAAGDHVDPVQNAAGEPDDALAVRGEPHAAPVAEDQGEPKGAFHGLDGATHRGLAGEQRLAGGGEAAVLRDGNQAA